jgi:pyruvate kinase
MLSSMESSSRPTRAEASDVFNAVLDGTDAVMLSGETAIGSYPVDAVATMSRIVAEAEHLVFAEPGDRWPNLAAKGEPPGRATLVQPITRSVVEAASLVCRRLDAALLIVATHSGRTALALSKRRNATPTLALADSAETARALALYWGVTPLHCPAISDVEHTLSFALDWALSRDLVAPGDHVILVRGTLPRSPAHNAMLVHEVS